MTRFLPPHHGPALLRVVLQGAACLVLFAGGARADEHRPPPGTDLLQLSSKLASGDVVILEPGSYPGQIQVLGKRVTLRGSGRKDSTLLGAEAGPTVVVAEGGHLTASNLTVRSSAGAVSVAVRGARLELDACDFRRLANSAIHGEEGATVYVSSCRFQEIESAAAVTLSDPVAGRVVDSTFQDCARAVSIRGWRPGDIDGDGYLLRIASNTFRGARDGFDAITVVDAAPAQIVANEFWGTHGGVRLEHGPREWGASRIEGNVFVDLAEHAIAVVRRAGIEEPQAVVVRDNLVVGARGAGVRLERAVQGEIAANTFVGATAAAISIRSGASATLVDNTIAAEGASSWAIHATSPGDIAPTGNVLLGSCSSEVGFERDPCGAAAEWLAARPELAEELRQRANAVAAAYGLSDAPRPRYDTVHVDGPPAIAALGETAAKLRETLGRLATITVRIADATGAETPVGFAVYDAAGGTLLVDVDAGGRATVEAGAYWVVPEGFPKRAQSIEVAAGERAEVVR